MAHKAGLAEYLMSEVVDFPEEHLLSEVTGPSEGSELFSLSDKTRPAEFNCVPKF